MATRATAVLAAIAAGVVVVVAGWWHSTRGISGPGGVLMARLPLVERGVGADRLARWHATIGRYTIGLISCHVPLIIWGYALQAHSGLVSETGTLLTGYPDVLMATVAWFLLLGVALVSMRAVRTKLRYETWYYLHFYTSGSSFAGVSSLVACGGSRIRTRCPPCRAMT